MNQPPHSTLPRVLGPWMASAVVVGTVIGSGVFKKARVVADNAPEFGLAMAVWVVGGMLAIFGALAYAEVAVRYPRAGGNYVFLREGYGRWAGFLWGWVDFTVIRSASIAVLATMATEALHDVLRQTAGSAGRTDDVLGFWPRQFVTVAVIAACTTVNARGTRIGGGLQLGLTALKVASLVGLIALPLAVFFSSPDSPSAPSTRHVAPVWPSDLGDVDWGKFGVALVGVLWAYHGWMNIGPIAEEVKSPNRNIPLCVVAGVLVVTTTYVGVNAAYYSALSGPEMAALSGTPVATEFCYRLLGPVGALVASLILMTSVLGSLNGNVLVAPRLLYAMAEDRLAPAVLKTVHPTYRTPVPALIVFSAWASMLVLGLGAMTVYRLPVVAVGGVSLDINLPAGKLPFDVLTDYAMFGALVFETMAVAAIFRFRYLARNSPPPSYRCFGYPLVPAVYVLTMSAVAMNMLISPFQRSEAVIGLGFFAVGGIVYLLGPGWLQPVSQLAEGDERTGE